MTKEHESQKEQDGLLYTRGGLKALSEVFLAVAVSAFALLWILHFTYPLDDTDKAWWSRSGFNLLIDHGTGAEYLQRGCAIIKREPKP